MHANFRCRSRYLRMPPSLLPSGRRRRTRTPWRGALPDMAAPAPARRQARCRASTATRLPRRGETADRSRRAWVPRRRVTAKARASLALALVVVAELNELRTPPAHAIFFSISFFLCFKIFFNFFNMLPFECDLKLRRDNFAIGNLNQTKKKLS